MANPKANENVRRFLAAAGAIGGKVHDTKKNRRPRREKEVRITVEPLADEDARTYLATIGAKGGRVLTEKKRAHLNKVASKGGKTVTPKKLAHLRKMVADRVAKQRAAREGR